MWRFFVIMILMIKVIPAINSDDFDIVESRIVSANKFLSHGGWVHIDVVDGEFAPNTTWDNPHDLGKLIHSHPEFSLINFEIHLMVSGPEEVAEAWLKAGAKRIIAHVEVIHDHHFLLEKCDEYEAEFMMAISPETPVERLSPYLSSNKYFQILAVKPGLAGQEFKPEVINKIRTLREKAPNAKIEVDGGINPETLKLCKSAGADLFVSASYIFGSREPAKAYKELVDAVM